MFFIWILNLGEPPKFYNWATVSAFSYSLQLDSSPVATRKENDTIWSWVEILNIVKIEKK